MNRRVLAGVLFLSALTIIGGYAYQYRGSLKIRTAESPEEVVKKFYSYVGEGGSSSLGEAYKLISTKHFILTEDKFKGIVLNYPSDMEVKVLSGRVIKDRAVVSIEYKMASAFGGDFITTTEIHLDLDEKSKSWKIDFTGETYAADAQKT